MRTTRDIMLKYIYFITLGVLTSLLIFSSCRDNEDVYSKPEVTVSPNEDIHADASSQSKSIQINTNRDWRIIKDNSYDWIDITPMEGKAGSAVITITVKSNEGAAREGKFIIKSSIVEVPINVIQADQNGNTIENITIGQLRELYTQNASDVLNIPGSYRLKAVVTSDFATNNILKRNGYLQDETSGIAFRVAEKEHTFKLGEMLYIDLTGATLSKYNEALQIGFSVSSATAQGEGTLPAPKELTLEELLNGNYDGILVKLMDVQFEDYKNKTYQEGKYGTNRKLQNCAGQSIDLRTIQYAKFKDEALPAGKGNIIGIVSKFRNGWQLSIRNLDDVKEMSNDASTRCEGDANVTPTPPNSDEETKISIGDLREALNNIDTYSESRYIEGEVILSPSANNQNVPEFIAYVADETGGITLTLSDKENTSSKLPLGSKVKVHIKGVKKANYKGLLQLGAQKSLSTSQVEIIEANPAMPLTPTEASISDILNGKYQSQLIKINSVQFKTENATYAGGQTIENENGEEITVYTRKQAAFSGENVPSGSGPFIGVVSTHNNKPQLIIRKTSDLSGMTNARFGNTTARIYADNTSVSFEKEGGTKTVNITASGDWTASSNQTWCAVTPETASGNGQITITAQANEQAQRSATVTLQSGTQSVTISVTQSGSDNDDNTATTATDLFISEYVEGKSFNKYIEIFNPTNSEIDLSAYSLKMDNYNGKNKTSGIKEVALSGTLGAKQAIVYKNEKAKLYTGGVTSKDISNVVNFNGNDPVALFKGTALIDIVGVWNSPWIDDNKKSIGQDVTLRRKASVKSPRDTYDANEWDSYGVDDTSDLGQHTMN